MTLVTPELRHLKVLALLARGTAAFVDGEGEPLSHIRLRHCMTEEFKVERAKINDQIIDGRHRKTRPSIFSTTHEQSYILLA